MPAIPQQFLAQSSIRSGGVSRGAQAVAFSGPRAIRPPQIAPRSLPAPFLETPQDKVGSLVSAQAIQGFSATIIDLAANKADQEAALIAKAKFRDFQDRRRNLMYNPESGYMVKRSQEAVQGYGDFQQSMNQLVSDTLGAASPYVKQKLFSMVEGSRNQTLNTAANHAAQQKGVWVKDSLEADSIEMDRDIEENIYQSNGDLYNRIVNSINVMPFANEADQQDFLSQKLGQSVTFLTQKRGQTLNAVKRLTDFTPFMTLKDIESVTRDVEQALNRDRVEEDRLEREQEREKAENRTDAINSIQMDFANVTGWNEKRNRHWADSDVITWGDYNRLKNQFIARGNRGKGARGDKEDKAVNFTEMASLYRLASDPEVDASPEIGTSSQSDSIKKQLIWINEASANKEKAADIRHIESFAKGITKTTGWKSSDPAEYGRGQTAAKEGVILYQDGKSMEEIEKRLMINYGASASLNRIGPMRDGTTPTKRNFGLVRMKLRQDLDAGRISPEMYRLESLKLRYHAEYLEDQ